MNYHNENLLDLIDDLGVKASVACLAEALVEFAHDASDMGLKESARLALQVSCALNIIHNNCVDDEYNDHKE